MVVDEGDGEESPFFLNADIFSFEDERLAIPDPVPLAAS